jgi:hypothetical protein
MNDFFISLSVVVVVCVLMLVGAACIHYLQSVKRVEFQNGWDKGYSRGNGEGFFRGREKGFSEGEKRGIEGFIEEMIREGNLEVRRFVVQCPHISDIRLIRVASDDEENRGLRLMACQRILKNAGIDNGEIQEAMEEIAKKNGGPDIVADDASPETKA